MVTTDEKIISLGVLSYNNDKMKEYVQEEIDKIPSATVDDTLSDISEHPVQNKVVTVALNSKADQTTVDSALSLKANSADVTASLAGKSDTGHTHDDRYYTESETNALLDDKVEVSVFDSHANNTTVHITAEEKAVWDSKAELTDIPTTLPANGGNADSVGGFNNRAIFRPYHTTSNANDCYTNGSYMCTPDTTNIPIACYGILVAFNGEGDKIENTWVCQNFYPTNSNYIYHRFWTNNTWTNWERMASVTDIPTSLPANGGNAATVNGLTVQTAVPANAKFTDTTYGAATASAAGLVTTGAQTLAGNKTFNGQVIPAGASAVGTAQARKIYAGTSDMTAGTTALETGAIYLVYE